MAQRTKVVRSCSLLLETWHLMPLYPLTKSEVAHLAQLGNLVAVVEAACGRTAMKACKGRVRSVSRASPSLPLCIPQSLCAARTTRRVKAEVFLAFSPIPEVV